MLLTLAAAAAIAASGPQSVDGVCFHPKAGEVFAIETVADFRIVTVTSDGKPLGARIYVGHNPDVGKENQKFVYGPLRDKLRSPRKIDLGSEGVLGVSKDEKAALYHVIGSDRQEVVRVARLVRFCSR